MADIGRDHNDISGHRFLDRLTFSLNPCAAFRNVERLAQWMRVPCATCAGLEAYESATDIRGLVSREPWTDFDLASEILRTGDNNFGPLCPRDDEVWRFCAFRPITRYDDILQHLRRLHRVRPSRVVRKVIDRLLRLGIRQAIRQGALDRIGELARFAGGKQRRHGDKATVAQAEGRPAPEVIENGVIRRLGELRNTRSYLLCKPFLPLSLRLWIEVKQGLRRLNRHLDALGFEFLANLIDRSDGVGPA